MKKIVQILLLTLLSLSVQAKNFTCSNKLNVNEVVPGNFIEVKNELYDFIKTDANWQSKLTYGKVENRIILSVNAKHSQYQPEGYQADVVLRITRDIIAPDGTITEGYEESLKTMSVTYYPDQAYNGKAVITLENGHNIKVEVVSVTPNVASKVMNLELIAETYFEQYRLLDFTEQCTISTNPDYVDSRNELEVTWPFIEGAEDYELEWTYVNNVSENGTYLAETEIEINDQIFRQNATKISLRDFSEHDGTQISYRIPLIYEQGYILYRVRALGVNIDNPGQVIAGSWSCIDDYKKVSEFKNSIDNKNNFFFIKQGHEEKLNWQSSVTFIEQGKNKVAVSYADGTLRSRQQVSRLNSEDETVIGETVYDHQGRKAVDIIPAPSNQQKIEYVPNYNVNSGKAYSRINFDLDTDDECNLAADPIEDASGAGKYYSTENELKFTHDVAIPNAQGYPFIQTVYTNDNTGRIRAQGGIGVDHKIGSGHETKNFYGKPLQVEIDRMFGSEAGYASHYQKNLVVDPNGQVTVSYLDMKGNVIATSLAGLSPKELKELASNVSTDIEEDLLVEERNAKGELVPKQTISDDKMSKVYNQEILVSSDNDEREFFYEVDPEKLEIELDCQDGTTIEKYCFDCVLNVELMVIDKCGKEKLLHGAHGAVVNANLLAKAIDENDAIDIKNCGRVIHPYTYSDVTEPLIIGDYTVRKVLTVNQAVLEHYTDSFLSVACLKTVDDFYEENKADIDITGCYTDCKKCEDDLGEYDQYDATLYPNGDCPGICMSYETYQKQLANCRELCDNEPTTCESKFNLMKSDVSPLGQYGFIENDGKFFALSVFNKSNFLPKNATVSSGNNVGSESNLTNGNAHWQKPIHYSTGNAGYYNEDGTRGLIEVKLIVSSVDGSRSFSPSLTNEGKTLYLTASLNEGDIIQVPAEYLADLESFVKNWPTDNSWSESLVIFHPEYGGYEYCLQNIESHKFDKAILNSSTPEEFISNYEDAFGIGAFNARSEDGNAFNILGTTSNNSLDPFFHPDTRYEDVYGDGSGVYFNNLEYKVMGYWMNNYKSYTSDDASVNENFSMIELAYLTVECPQYGLVSGCNERFCHYDEYNDKKIIGYTLPVAEVDAGLEVDKIWQAYKSFYIAEKKKLYDIKRNQVSIQEDFYCGCIGNKNWNLSKDRYGFTRINTGDPDVKYLIPGGLNALKISGWFNMNQPCSWNKFHLFIESEPIFPNLQAESPANFNSGIECHLTSGETGIDDFKSDLFPNTDCPERDNALIGAMQIKSMDTYMQTCGECPIVFDFESLLNILAKNEKLESVPEHHESDVTSFGCYPDGLEGWTDLINMSANFTGTTAVTYHSVATGNLLSGSFKNSSGASMVLKLLADASYTKKKDNQETTTFSIEFDKIKSVCCVEYDIDEVPSEFDGLAGSPFNVYATVYNDELERDVKVKLEGFVGMDLHSCSFKKCDLTQVAYDLSNFFSVLATQKFDFTTGEFLPGPFTSNDIINMYDGGDYKPEFRTITEELFTNGPGGTEEISAWEWEKTSSSSSVHSFTAKLTSFNAGSTNLGSVEFTFTTVDHSNINFGQIVSFLAIEPLLINGVDVNEDGDFDDAGEKVISESGFEALVQMYDGTNYTTKRISVIHNMNTVFKTATCFTYN